MHKREMMCHEFGLVNSTIQMIG